MFARTPLSINKLPGMILLPKHLQIFLWISSSPQMETGSSLQTRLTTRLAKFERVMAWCLEPVCSFKEALRHPPPGEV